MPRGYQSITKPMHTPRGARATRNIDQGTAAKLVHDATVILRECEWRCSRAEEQPQIAAQWLDAAKAVAIARQTLRVLCHVDDVTDTAC